MLTTTKFESGCINDAVLLKYKTKVHRLLEDGRLGIDNFKASMEPLNELRIAIYALGYWEQDKFTYLNNINYLNDYDIRSIYRRARDL